ncbi:hypothetical protein IT408_03505 [Candidatus Uhrbacteria bacterium]|nr:hypothetical protein [Candidatus Uhrbacteria bacterium]
MARVTKKEEEQRLQNLHNAIAQHARVEPNIYFWLIHVFHWHVAIMAAIAITIFSLSVMSGSSIHAQEFEYQSSMYSE